MGGELNSLAACLTMLFLDFTKIALVPDRERRMYG